MARLTTTAGRIAAVGLCLAAAGCTQTGFAAAPRAASSTPSPSVTASPATPASPTTSASPSASPGSASPFVTAAGPTVAAAVGDCYAQQDVLLATVVIRNDDPASAHNFWVMVDFGAFGKQAYQIPVGPLATQQQQVTAPNPGITRTGRVPCAVDQVTNEANETPSLSAPLPDPSYVGPTTGPQPGASGAPSGSGSGAPAGAGGAVSGAPKPGAAPKASAPAPAKSDAAGPKTGGRPKPARS